MRLGAPRLWRRTFSASGGKRSARYALTRRAAAVVEHASDVRFGADSRARAPDLRGGDSSHGGPPEVQSQDAGNATAQHGREADLRPAHGLRCSAGTERARHQRDHGDGGNHQDRRHASHRPPIDVAETDRRCGPAGPSSGSSGTAGPWSALWSSADCSPQKSAGLGGGSSASGDAARGPNGTSSSRGPSQSRGRRTILPRG